MIVLVLIFGAGLGWVVRSARIQREAVAAIQKAGGGVLYSWEWQEGDDIWGEKPWPPEWLAKRIGIDYFDHVVVVYVHSTSRISDDEMVSIGDLASLKELCLDGSSVTDAGLANLKRLNGLRRLELDHTQVTDAGLKYLKRLTKLTDLQLDDTRITDAGLANLKGLTKLVDLDVSGTQVTDFGVSDLQQALPHSTIYR
jgi:internalin A